MARALVPWDGLGDGVGGLTVEVFNRDSPDPGDVSDVEFYVMPYAWRGNLQLIPRMASLQVIQSLNAGYDDVLAVLPPGVTLANGRGLHDASTAEHAMALMLAAQRDIPRWARQQRDGHWEQQHTRSLADCRVLIVGHGSIGAALEARLAPFEVEVVKMARRPRPAEGVRGAEDLHALLPTADVVVLIVPLTDSTAGMFGAKEFALLRDDALVVNVGRGKVLDTKALLAEGGRVRAALDVTDPEPLPDGHPLWSAPGVLISPHVGGGSATFYPRAKRFITEQLRRYAAGEPLRNVVVDPQLARPR